MHKAETSQTSTDFLTPVNPDARPRIITRTTYYFDPREILLTQPALAKRERLPAFLRLKEGELALSSEPKPGYFYLKHLGWYAPNRHKMLLDLIDLELEDETVPHGTLTGYNKGCTGPLCRRTNRETRRKTRTNQPIYHGVDPLLAVMTAYAYQQQQTKPRTDVEKRLAKLLEKEAARQEFGPQLIN